MGATNGLCDGLRSTTTQVVSSFNLPNLRMLRLYVRSTIACAACWALAA
eukprot:CAMPEP_0174740598 /NCGR_PEP_ID=MMETSP1094-20130205/73991_1 /TAXON_ID=156173 /ORGANISM="Chrysochromulina brevifilum, Strain UTEX LB 985" /LENGTH=48 /DNA_ID= /DNA_START= /DNA_END= /DNA_ORIENTATION=